MNTKRVLIVVCNKGIGDGLEALPVFEMIQRYWPGVSLAAGSFSPGFQPELFRRSPYIDETVMLSGSIKDVMRALKAAAHNIRAMRPYDDVLFLYKFERISWPMLLAGKLAGARVHYRHGYRYRDGRKSTYSDFPEHIFFQLVASSLLLGLASPALLPMSIDLSKEERSYAEEFFRREGLGRRPVVIINTRGIGQREWGIQRFALVAKALVEAGVDVIINGGSVEQVIEFESVAPALPRGVSLLNRPSPFELAAVIEKCDLFIGEPSGPTSFAMAVGTATISVQGPGEYGYPGQERIGPRWWPRGDMHQFACKVDLCQLQKRQNCQCSRPPHRPVLEGVLRFLGVRQVWKATRKRLLKFFGIYRRKDVPDTHPCLEMITVDEVAALALGQLNRRRVTEECTIQESL